MTGFNSPLYHFILHDLSNHNELILVTLSSIFIKAFFLNVSKSVITTAEDYLILDNIIVGEMLLQLERTSFIAMQSILSTIIQS